MLLDRRILAQVLADQREAFEARARGVAREVALASHLAHDRIVVITGLRRTGKSTLLRQIAHRLDDYHFADLDDERLTLFGLSDFQTMLELWNRRSDANIVLLDEVQEVAGWERFVRRIADAGYKVIVTGSNAKLLSSELGTHLTGRYSRVELFPFCFTEYLRLRQISWTEQMTTVETAAVEAAFEAYLTDGGMPAIAPKFDRAYLQQVYEDVLNRDILVRHGIRRAKAFRDLTHWLFTNFTGDLGYSRLARLLGYKSADSISAAVDHLQQAYLVFEVMKYDYSLSKQHVNDKKIYVVDNGMRAAVAFQFSPDFGKYLENLVFLALRRRGCEVYFSREKNECDFVVVDGREIVAAIQVCQFLSPENESRELAGLADVHRRAPDAQLLLLTSSQTDSRELPDGGPAISIEPVWRWLLRSGPLS